MEIEIKNLKTSAFRSKAWQFRVDRKSPVGNPFVMHSEAERDIVCDKYDVYFIVQMVINETFCAYLNDILLALKTYGRVELYCWCVPKRCHAETIKRWLEKQIHYGESK